MHPQFAQDAAAVRQATVNNKKYIKEDIEMFSGAKINM